MACDRAEDAPEAIAAVRPGPGRRVEPERKRRIMLGKQ
jgi:hypothetical protein